MTNPIIQKIVTPPIMPQKTTKRNRLIDLLINNINKNLLLVYSPAGYGKTTLIQSFLSKQNLNFSWLNVTSDIDHVYTFFKYLVQSLRRINENFGDCTLEIIESWNQRYMATNNPRNAINDILSTFVKEFSDKFHEDIILVIDDLQYIDESKWFKDTFNTLIDIFPKNLHLIIITRQVPNFNMLPLIEKGQILKIGMEDLIFRFDEIIELLKDIYSFDYSEDGVKLLENNIGGWITGIHLILQTYGKNFDHIKLDHQKIPENIFNFLAEEIFKHLDKETQNFLTFTSLLDIFNADECNHLLDIKNSDVIIKTLLEKNLFLQPVPFKYEDTNNYTITYNYHTLFKKFLNYKLNELYGTEKINELLKKIFGYYSEKKDIISAINALMKTHDYNILIPIIIENFDYLFNEGKFEFLWKWLKNIEDEVELHNPYIIFYLGILYKYYIGDLEKSLAYLEKAISMFEKNNDQNALIRCYVTKNSILINKGYTKDVIAELTNLAEKHTSTENRSYLLYYLATAYYHNAEYDTSVRLFNEALKLNFKDHRTKELKNIYNLLGNIELIKGNYNKSVPYYEKVLQNKPDLFNKIETLCNLVLMNSQAGDYVKAKEYFNQLEQIVKNFPNPLFKIPFLLSKQAYLFELRKYQENIGILSEISSIAKHMNHKQYTYLSYRLLIDSYYYSKDCEKAKEYLGLSEQFIAKNNELENIELMVLRALLYSQNGGNSCENTLLKAYEYYNENEYVFPKIQICYKLASFYLDKDEKEKAIKYLKESFCSANKNNYRSYFIREYCFSDKLMNFSLKNKIETDFVNSLIEESN